MMKNSGFLNLAHCPLKIGIDEAIDAIPSVIGILKTFDPAIPNDLAVFFGLKYARENGINNVMTGDGADEFFAGYDFMKKIKGLDKYINRISKSPYFSSNQLGKFFNIKIKQPFLQKEFIHLSLEIPTEYKIKKERGEIFGKWILRKAFEDRLPEEIIWQQKRPLEVGSGMSRLRQILNARITDKEFEEKKREYQIKFMNKEHLYYYEVYRETVGAIPRPMENEMMCDGCGAGMKPNSFHCKICGNVLEWGL